MTAPVRRAGESRLADGSIVTWTVAEGTKGRRWREVVVRDGAIVHSLLLETFPDGHFAHLELATPAGLLTLHPEGDGTLHGNAVTVDGVRHVAGLPWPDGSVLLVAGSIFSRAAAAGIGSAAGSAVVVHLDLSLESRPGDRVDLGDFVDPAVSLDADGLPLLPGGRSWPLELD